MLIARAYNITERYLFLKPSFIKMYAKLGDLL